MLLRTAAFSALPLRLGAAAALRPLLRLLLANAAALRCPLRLLLRAAAFGALLRRSLLNATTVWPLLRLLLSAAALRALLRLSLLNATTFPKSRLGLRVRRFLRSATLSALLLLLLLLAGASLRLLLLLDATTVGRCLRRLRPFLGSAALGAARLERLLSLLRLRTLPGGGRRRATARGAWRIVAQATFFAGTERLNLGRAVYRLNDALRFARRHLGTEVRTAHVLRADFDRAWNPYGSRQDARAHLIGA